MKAGSVLLRCAELAFSARAQAREDLPGETAGGPKVPAEFDPLPGAAGVRADTGVRIGWFFPSLLPDDKGTCITGPLRFLERPSDPVRDALPGASPGCVEDGHLRAKKRGPK